MESPFPFKTFISLHRMLLYRMLLLDLFLGISGSIFMTVPLHIFAFSLNNLALLMLFIFSTVAYQIHIFRTYAGAAAFYLRLPVGKYRLFQILLVDSLFPAVFALSITAIVFTLSGAVYACNLIATAERACHMLLVLFIMKTIALPVFILYKRHIVLNLLFPGSLVIVYWLISIAGEVLHLSNMVTEFLFLTGTEAICARILMNAGID